MIARYIIFRDTWSPDILFSVTHDRPIYYFPWHMIARYIILRDTWSPDILFSVTRDRPIYYFPWHVIARYIILRDTWSGVLFRVILLYILNKISVMIYFCQQGHWMYHCTLRTQSSISLINRDIHLVGEYTCAKYMHIFILFNISLISRDNKSYYSYFLWPVFWTFWS